LKNYFKKRNLFIFIGLIVLNSCTLNYSFTGASISPDIKTVSVKFFPNYAPLAQPILSQAFTEALRDIFISQTSLNLVDKNGDLHFEGSITGYQSNPTAIQSGEVAQASLNRLSITVNVIFTNKLDEKQNFETNFTRFADYDASRNLADVETALIKEINDQLVQDIFNKAVTNW
jgi:hypothetical protein